MGKHRRPINSSQKDSLGIPTERIKDADVREAMNTAQHNIDELYSRLPKPLMPMEDGFDHQPENNREYERIWRAIKEMENSGGSGGGGGGGIDIPDVNELPAIPTSGTKRVRLLSDTPDRRQVWETSSGEARWYPRNKLTSGNGLPGME